MDSEFKIMMLMYDCGCERHFGIKRIANAPQDDFDPVAFRKGVEKAMKKKGNA